jgi:hypothetical protein
MSIENRTANTRGDKINVRLGYDRVRSDTRRPPIPDLPYTLSPRAGEPRSLSPVTIAAGISALVALLGLGILLYATLSMDHPSFGVQQLVAR